MNHRRLLMSLVVAVVVVSALAVVIIHARLESRIKVDTILLTVDNNNQDSGYIYSLYIDAEFKDEELIGPGENHTELYEVTWSGGDTGIVTISIIWAGTQTSGCFLVRVDQVNSAHIDIG